MNKGQSGQIATPFPKKGEPVSVSVLSMEPLSGGRWKVKVKEPNLHLLDMNHEGMNYVTVKDYGRGRYIMRLSEISAMLDKEWEETK
jgi:hypothetical protein